MSNDTEVGHHGDSGAAERSAAPRGLILFGHGARDPRWAEPFERLAKRVAEQSSGNQGQPGPVTLAYLELMTPSLATAIDEQVLAGCKVITVVPVFFGQGAHLRRDFPALLDACRLSHPDVDIRTTDAVGEVDSVIAAIGDYVVKEW
jgi:sirohydrochlorin cobaltochelatase